MSLEQQETATTAADAQSNIRSSSDLPVDGVNKDPTAQFVQRNSALEDEFVITQVDDLVIKSYPDGRTVLLRPDGTELQSSAADPTELFQVAPPPADSKKSEENANDDGTTPTSSETHVEEYVTEEDPTLSEEYSNDSADDDSDFADGTAAADGGSDTEIEIDDGCSTGDEIDEGDTGENDDWAMTTDFTTAVGEQKASSFVTTVSSLDVEPEAQKEPLGVARNATVVVRPPPKLVSSGCPFHSGWLFKEGGSYKSWKRRWFELFESGQLLYYDKQRELGGKFINSVDISDSTIAANPHSKRPFGIVIQTVASLTKVSNKRGKYILAGSNTQDRDRWITALTLSAGHPDGEFYSASFSPTLPAREMTQPSSDAAVRRSVPSVAIVQHTARGANSDSSSLSTAPGATSGGSRKGMSMRWTPASKMRALVSKNKLRFQEKGPSGHQYDLDLGYITDRVIAMGYPSDGTESLYRNKWDEVRMFLEDFHTQRYRVYNLCAERAYPPQRFKNRLAVYPFNDHGVPPLSLIQRCCEDMAAWLELNGSNVCAVHCKAGKGRTGLIVCCFLLHTGTTRTADEALEVFGSRRCADARGITLASQIRYVKYYERYLNGWVPEDSQVHRVLHELVVNSIPLEHASVSSQAFPFYVEIEQDNELVYTSKDTIDSLPKEPNGSHTDLKLTPDLEVTGDVVIRLLQIDNFVSSQFSCQSVCAACFNVGYAVMSASRLDFDKTQLDNPHKHKTFKRADVNFGFSLDFS